MACKRARPAELVPGTVSVITARMDYLPRATPEGWQAVEFERLQRPAEGVVSLYARGRDYHKVLRSRLQQLSERIAAQVGPFGHRVFTDSAPVLEAELAARSGQGWRGKHTLVLNRDAGSMFFLGEIYVDLALPASEPASGHCGTCSACIDVCPTQAIVAPYRLDARRCISYLTIEHAGAIPAGAAAADRQPHLRLRRLPADLPLEQVRRGAARLPDFDERAGPDRAAARRAVRLDRRRSSWRCTEGSPIRRIGHERWLRNVAVAVGNALRQRDDPELRAALQAVADHPSALVREHVAWALAQGSGRNSRLASHAMKTTPATGARYRCGRPGLAKVPGRPTPANSPPGSSAHRTCCRNEDWLDRLGAAAMQFAGVRRLWAKRFLAIFNRIAADSTSGLLQISHFAPPVAAGGYASRNCGDRQRSSAARPARTAG